MIRKQIYIDEQDPRFSTDEDPLLKLVGLVDNPDLPEDIAERHDHFVYGSAERRS